MMRYNLCDIASFQHPYAPNEGSPKEAYVPMFGVRKLEANSAIA